MDNWVKEMTDDPEVQKDIWEDFQNCYPHVKHFLTMKTAVDYGIEAWNKVKDLPEDEDWDKNDPEGFWMADIMIAPKEYSEGGRYCLCPKATLQAMFNAGFQPDDGGKMPRDPQTIAYEKGWLKE